MVERSSERLPIGWREYVSFPDWGVRNVKAKIDTGAKSCAIDVAKIEELPGHFVVFEIVTHRKDVLKKKKVRAHIVRRARVRSSNGAIEHRIMVMGKIKIGSVEKTVEVGLVCRKNMLCRVLVGREGLGRDFVIYPAKKYLQKTKKKI